MRDSVVEGHKETMRTPLLGRRGPHLVTYRAPSYRQGMPDPTIRRVAVFCGSADGISPTYRELAEATGRAIARRGWGLVYGGAQVGIMGAVADAALAEGGQVYGVIPRRIARKEVAHFGLAELFVVDSMHARKAMMAHLSDAFCVLPGGFGTLDETFEALTWTQLGYHRKPVGLLGPEAFWRHIVAHCDYALSQGFLQEEHRALLHAGTEVEAVMDYLATALPPETQRWIDKP